MSNIRAINAAIKAYFNAHPDEDVVAVKKLMPLFVEKGIYPKNIKNGQPIRNELKWLDKENQLKKIRTVHVVRKGKHNFWYFLREGAEAPALEIDKVTAPERSKRTILKRQRDDEHYVIDLCDEALGLTALRHHSFEFLKGDMHRNGRTRSLLPCDAYYSELKLVIEYHATPDEAKVAEASGESAENPSVESKRKIYAERKRKVLPEHEMTLIEIDAGDFEQDELSLIKRDRKRDMALVKSLLYVQMKRAAHIQE